MNTLASSSEQRARPHVVVLGAGFGGLAFVKAFPRDLARITVVDRTNHHLFQPLLYQVATAGLSAPDIAEPIRALVRKRPDVTVLMGTVTDADFERRTLTVDGRPSAFDLLVLAVGNRTSYFGNRSWAAFASGLKTIDDAIRIRRSVLHAFERAEVVDDDREREKLLTVAVVGGGPTGVEMAGALAELQRRVLARDFRRARLRSGRVVLVEASDRLLSPFPEKLSRRALEQLRSLGVQVLLGQRVEDVRDGELDLGETVIRAANIVWSAGVTTTDLVHDLPLRKDRGGRIEVAPDLSVPDHDGIYALGDAVVLRDAAGVSVPAIAPAAMQMGRHVAAECARRIRERDTTYGNGRPFVYRDKGYMATVGRSRAVARIGRLRFSGFTAWILWLTVHLAFLAGFENKLSVFVKWIFSYVFYRRGARVIHGIPDPSTRDGVPACETASRHSANQDST